MTGIEAFLRDLKVAQREDMANTLVTAMIAAALAFWAYGTLAHSFLFSFVAFSTSAVGNRVVWEMRRQRAVEIGRRFDDPI